MSLSIQGRPDEKTGLAVIAAFIEAGGDFIDTAISYCLDDTDLGHNERLIAKALATTGAQHVHVATKGGVTRPDGRWEVDCRPSVLRRGCEQSVRDLGGPIALYYLHAVDAAVPLADSLGELVKLRDEGKIRAIGLSNVSAKQLDEGLRVAPIAAVQNRCNVFDRRDVDNGLVDRCAAAGIAYVPYSPVGGHRNHARLANDVDVARVAAKHSVSVYAVALAWLLARGSHVLPIPGATKVASTLDSLRATAITLDANDVATLDKVGAGRR